MKQVTIIIAGGAASGKSTLAQIIRWACMMHNIKTVVQEAEPETVQPETFMLRCETLQHGTEVTIKQVNTTPSPSEN